MSGENRLAALMGEAVAELEEELEIEKSVDAQPILPPKSSRRPPPAAGAGAGSAPLPARPSTAPAAVSSSSSSSGFSKHQSAFSGPTEEEVAEADAAAVAAAAPTDPDEFGIVYKKMELPKKSVLPSGPAFADEKLFEKEVEASEVAAYLTHSAAAHDDDDDEFEFDIDDGSGGGGGGGGSKGRSGGGLVQSARERERERKLLKAKQEAEAAKALEEMRKETARLAGVKLDEEKEAEEKAKAAAAAASSSSSGGSSSGPPTELMSTARPSGGLMGAVIEEGDEDEEEDDDDEDDEAMAAAIAEAQRFNPVSGSGSGGGGGDASAAQPFPEPDSEDEAAALEAEFEQATAVVHQRELAAREAGPGAAGAVIVHPQKLKYAVAEKHFFEETPLHVHMATIVSTAPDPNAGCCAGLFRTSLSPDLARQRDHVFCVAKVAFDPANDTHQRVMSTVYKGLTGVDLLGTGSSWEVVGFQRSDFRTDLRGGGMLGPLQTLVFLERHHPFVLKVFKLSKDPVQEFPFMVQSIQVTAKCLQALRIGKLNGLVTSAGNAMAAFNAFFFAMWFEFYDQWVAKAGTVAKMFDIMTAVVDKCYKDPAAVVARFNAKIAAPQFQPKKEDFSAMG